MRGAAKVEQDLNEQRAEVDRIKRDWEVQMHEISAARDSLAELRRQLEQELARATEQKQGVLDATGLTQEPGKPGSSSVPALPTEVENTLRKSAERFQKLCRDAKRKLLGDNRPS